ncbi:MAG: PAS domain S-box protein [Deltaproteobacteria bacterium]|nr:PAS domain S-box protein [Deltaproteobacteria bacterium]MBW2138416.1 PAS domain S-box protein [Deltaproteobacteria bacterium]
MGTQDQTVMANRLEKLKIQMSALRAKSAVLKAENKRLQKALRNRNLLFDEFPGGMVLVQGDKIMDVNRMVIEETGYDREEIVGRNFSEFLHPRVRERIRRFHKKRLAGKWAPELYQAEILAKDGAILCCEVEVKRIRFNGQVAFLTRLNRIEERKKREGELITSEKMEALGRMASGLSHRISEGLRAIREGAGSIRTALDKDQRDLAGPLEAMENAIGQLDEVARDLGHFSGGKGGGSVKVLFDLKELVRDRVARLEPRIRVLEEDRKAKFNIKTYLRSVSPVEGDPMEMREVVDSIIMNALEAMPGGGDLYITTEEDAGYVMTYVQDSGVGVPQDCLGKIFEPCLTLRESGGRGMGLSIAYGAVRRHKGDIEIRSTEGQGTTVTIRLPVVPKTKYGGERRKKTSIRDSNILVVGGGDMMQELLCRVLASKGFRVAIGNGYGDALNKLKKNRYDMVILDTEGRDEEAQALLRRTIKRKDKTSTILITGHWEDKGAVHGSTEGPDLVLRRPIDMDRLVRQVSDLLMEKL